MKSGEIYRHKTSYENNQVIFVELLEYIGDDNWDVNQIWWQYVNNPEVCIGRGQHYGEYIYNYFRLSSAEEFTEWALEINKEKI